MEFVAFITLGVLALIVVGTIGSCLISTIFKLPDFIQARTEEAKANTEVAKLKATLLHQQLNKS